MFSALRARTFISVVAAPVILNGWSVSLLFALAKGLKFDSETDEGSIFLQPSITTLPTINTIMALFNLTLAKRCCNIEEDAERVECGQSADVMSVLPNLVCSIAN
jgi:hypothetical protein